MLAAPETVTATLINPTIPALTFAALAVVLGLVFSRFGRAGRGWRLLAPTVVIGAFVVSRNDLPLEFSAYATDLLYEPLIRDYVLRNPGAGLASLLLHLGVSYFVLTFAIWRRETKLKTRGAEGLHTHLEER